MAESKYCIPNHLGWVLGIIANKRFRRAAEAVPQYIWDLSDNRLDMLAKPTLRQGGCRTALWEAIRYSKVHKKRLNIHSVVTQHFSYANWITTILGNPAKVAWFLRPGFNSWFAVDILHLMILERMKTTWEILNGRLERPTEASILELHIALQMLERFEQLAHPPKAKF